MSFNNPRVVQGLNAFTVPVYLSNGLVSPADKTELTRIHQEGYAKKLSVGSVHAFLLSPDGTLLDSVHVAQANPQRFLSMLETHAAAQKISSGPPLVRPNPPALPTAPKKGLRLHVVARYLEKRPDGTLELVRNAGGNWGALPGEDWPVFDRTEVQALLSGKREVAERLLTYFYPPTENNDTTKNRFETLDWKVTPVAKGQLRLSGSLTLKHPFYHKDDANRAVSSFVGYATGNTFELVTIQGLYSNLPFGVAVSSG